jgi:hypothetical protein
MASPDSALRYMPADAMEGIAAEDLPGGASGTWMEPPARERLLFRYAPEFIDDPTGAGIFAGLGTAVYRSPPVFAMGLRDARLVGYRTTISDGGFRDDEILVDGPPAIETFLDKIAQPDAFPNEQTGLRRLPDGRFELGGLGRTERHIPGTTVVLCSHEPSNYGSLLFRVIPKLVTLGTLGLADLPMIAWTWNPAFQRLLAIAGVAPEQQIPHDVDAITRLDRAIVPSLRNPNAFLDRESHAFMQGLSDRYDHPPFGRRLYISRLRHGRVSGSTRVMTNEDVLAARLGALDFEVIEPERLTLEEQIATFASADLVVGPSGSAMFNTVFCRPGTKIVDIESEPHWIYAHAGLFASCSLRYGLVVGRTDPADPSPVHKRWSVEVEPLMERLAAFIRA